MGGAIGLKTLTQAVLLSGLLYLTLIACGGKTAPPEQEDESQVVVAAGDIADCDATGDDATARLVANIEGTVLTLGDTVYERGTAEEYANCYDPTWGRFKERTKPISGNHEWQTPGASGYFDYFGAVAGNADESYYSYDLGSWHMVALNSSCWKIGGCDEESPQVRWLKADLASIGGESCTLAYLHHPLFTSGEHRPGMSKVRPLWEALYQAGTDVILSGHDHNYQRFAPQDPFGRADPEGGIRQFVVGTGGRNHYAIEDPIENTVAYSDDTFGVLKLTLRSDGYEWKFVPVAGKTFTDSGTARCH